MSHTSLEINYSHGTNRIYHLDESSLENLSRDELTDIIRTLSDIREDIHRIRERIGD